MNHVLTVPVRIFPSCSQRMPWTQCQAECCSQDHAVCTLCRRCCKYIHLTLYWVVSWHVSMCHGLASFKPAKISLFLSALQQMHRYLWHLTMHATRDVVSPTIKTEALMSPSLLADELTFKRVCLQEMWDEAGIVWEWTWYSQTVHAFTQPFLAGANATAVSHITLALCLCLPAPVPHQHGLAKGLPNAVHVLHAFIRPC